MIASFISKLFVVCLVVSYTIQLASGAYCNGHPDDGERTSELPIFDEELTFIRSVPNAMLFEAGPANARIPIVHLWGTPYEMGLAQGQLRKKEINEFIGKVWTYLVDEIVEDLPDSKWPQWLKDIILSKGMTRALEWTAKVTKDFTPQDYFDELQGLADGSGVSYDKLNEASLFPELTKAQCSFFGAWGTATAANGHTYQLRSLDFDTTGPFKDYPQVTVYHPNKGHAWAQVSWPGVIGALTAISDQQLAISEIGVSYPDDSFGQGTYPNTPPEKVHGEPWMYILRDTLQWEDSLSGAQNRINTSNRTCNLIIGVGDGESAMVNGLEYSGYVANWYSDSDLLPVNETWHVPIEDVVYNGMDWLCPSFNQVLGDQLRKYHGSIDENVVVRNILPTVQTGDLHIAFYDLTDQNMHVSFARPAASDPSEPFNAYERQFTRLHMKDIFAQRPPIIQN